jgi:amino acid transporter
MELVLLAGVGYAILSLSISLFVLIVTLAAMATILRKAGYSGWWIAVPVGSVVLWIVVALSRFSISGLLKLQLVLGLVNWLLFLVFAFSKWPALTGHSPRLQGLATPGGRPPEQPLPMPSKVQDPGWYQVGATNNDQAYWDGQGWTARRRWEGAGWTTVPLMPAEPEH